MNKTEYIAELTANSQVFTGIKEITPKLDAELVSDGTRAYTAHMLVKMANGIFSGVTQTFFVVDEGEASEAVYPTIKENKDYVENEFRVELRTYIDANFISASMPRITIDSLNEDQDFAVCTAYLLNVDGAIETKRYFVYRDNSVMNIKEYIG